MIFKDKKTELIVSWIVVVAILVISIVGYKVYGETLGKFEIFVVGALIFTTLVSTIFTIYDNKRKKK